MPPNNGWPAVREFYARVPVYLQKDDHDMMFDDASLQMAPVGELTFQDGKAIWYELAPVSHQPYLAFRFSHYDADGNRVYGSSITGSGF